MRTLQPLALAFLLTLSCVTGRAMASQCEVPGTCEEQQQAQEVARLLSIFEESLAGNNLAEAEVLAKRIIELSISINGRESTASANALTLLAVVQHEQEQHLTAIQNFHAAISTLERVEGMLSPDLIRPLQGLGETELAIGEPGRARSTFLRAIHVSHVNDGPQNIHQVATLNSISEVDRRIGNYKGALETQKNVLAIHQRATRENPLELVPALQHHAEWMRRLNLPNRERNTYSQMLEIQEKHLGKEDLALVPTLLAMGISVREPEIVLKSSDLGGELDGTAQEGLDDRFIVRAVKPDYYLRRAMEIAAGHPASDWQLETNTALRVGDYYSRMRRLVKARLAYTEAWNRLSSFPDGIRVRRDQLESPRPLTRSYLPEYFEDGQPVYQPEDESLFNRGSLSLLYDVSELGKTVNIRVAGAQPVASPEIQELIVDRLGDRIHRPRMEDGEIVDTYDMEFVHDFFYRYTEGREDSPESRR